MHNSVPATPTTRAELSIDFDRPMFSASDHGIVPTIHDGVIINHIEPVFQPVPGFVIHIVTNRFSTHPCTTVSIGEVLDGTVIIRRTDDPHELVLCRPPGYAGRKFLAIHQDTLTTICDCIGIDHERILSIRPPLSESALS